MSGIFPSLRALVRLLPALHGADRRALISLPAACQSGSVDDDPLLQDLGARIRRATDGQVDPRNVIGYWDVASRYKLLIEGDDYVLRLGCRGEEAVRRPEGRALSLVAGREGLRYLITAVQAGTDTLAALLPGWRQVLAGNPRFAAPTSHARSLGQRVAALVTDGCLVAHGEHATRLADEAGFRGREPEPAFADLGGTLEPGPCATSCAGARQSVPLSLGEP